MPNIYLKLNTEEKNLRSQILNFLFLKNLSSREFWGAPTHEDTINF